MALQGAKARHSQSSELQKPPELADTETKLSPPAWLLWGGSGDTGLGLPRPDTGREGAPASPQEQLGSVSSGITIPNAATSQPKARAEISKHCEDPVSK